MKTILRILLLTVIFTLPIILLEWNWCVATAQDQSRWDAVLQEQVKALQAKVDDHIAKDEQRFLVVQNAVLSDRLNLIYQLLMLCFGAAIANTGVSVYHVRLVRKKKVAGEL